MLPTLQHHMDDLGVLPEGRFRISSSGSGDTVELAPWDAGVTGPWTILRW